jgi:hypothetical protein
MLKIKESKANYLVIDISGVELLFSYTTCVAGYTPDEGYFKTNEFFSHTTSKHIGEYLKKQPFNKIPQNEIKHMLNNIKIKW